MSIRLTTKTKEKLEKMGISKLTDILSYFPYRYEVIEYIPFKDWKIGTKIIIEATVTDKPKINYYRGKNSILYLNVVNEDDFFRVSIFNRHWLMKLQVNEKITIIGTYEGNNRILASHINMQPLKEQIGIKPYYSLKEGIREKTFLRIVDQVIKKYQENIIDFIPEYIKKENNFLSKKEAVKQIHQPENKKLLSQAINTLKYEEFLKFNLVMAKRRSDSLILDSNFKKEFDIKKVKYFIQQLPFKLTDDQNNAIKEILSDLQSERQMARILQGDVGCGKTIVAFIVMYATVLAEKQAAIMAPTEILAKQHYSNMINFFNNYDVEIGILYSSQSIQERRMTLEKIKNKEIKLIVGTHSLFQEQVEFNNLGLVVTDEQHRFGVKQRQSFLLKGEYVDMLLMSATPIPRTLATTLYGDLDVTTITQTPYADKKVHTVLIKQNSFISKIDEIENLLNQKNQMYVVCPAIDKGKDNIRNVNDIYTNLKKHYQGRYKVGLLHGQLDQQQKQIVERQFSDGEIDILVCTTVIEVGVDVKNANVMIIYDANRFGLSQLHQLRGRIGRGEKQGYCYLLTSSQEDEIIEKLNVIVNNNDGFKISYYDLLLRGPGDILGYRQSGLPTFILGNIIKDNKLLNDSSREAKKLIKELDKYPLIDNYLKQTENESVLDFQV
ncbi:MAG: ATP-dependent DNA helicase RecG [Bacillota bacterium]|jgi:ATP-dependent DNA helicase RecG|nr:ATP-dependent DNA helicase RecG [Bacillota bacterium]